VAATEQSIDVDLLVAGAGAAGLTAALVGTLEGLQVLLIEKSDLVGGTTATSAGTMWIPGTRQSKAAGVPDTLAAARTYLDGMLGTNAADARLAAYLATGPVVLDYLAARTSLRFMVPPVHPDYRDLPGAAIGGRALTAVPFDGRRLGADFDRLRPPRREFMVLGGMMVGKDDVPALMHPMRSFGHLAHVVRLLARQGWDRLRYRRGTRLLMGNALVGALFHDLCHHGVDMRYRTELRDLIRDNDRIVGAVLETPSGPMQVRARKGVMLATGGIGWSDSLRARLLPESARRYSLAPRCITGDGLLAAERVSADIDTDMTSAALWMPSSVMTQPDGQEVVFPHIFLDRAKPGLLAVNSAGRRFVNEADSYHDVVEAMLRSNRHAAAVPAFLVCDATFIADYGLGLIRPGTRNLDRYLRVGYLVTGDTIGELAGRIGVDGLALAQTVERYNRSAELGIDAEFGRGATPLNRVNGDPRNTPNPCLRRIGPGPYFAMAIWPSDLASSAGLRTDANGRVLDAQGRLLQGLYAAGNDAASIFRGTYPGPGTMIGPAMVFAWRAAMDAAGVLDDDLADVAD
jgi:succinate dehydrogenase/fumarate reductase flavoprotein subunit